MNIAEFGNTFVSTNKIEYLSDRTLIEFDFLIIEEKGLFASSNREEKSKYDKRKSNLTEFIKYKNNPLIFFAPQPTDVYLNVGGAIKKFTLQSLLPVPNFEVEREVGEKIVINQKTIFTDFLKKYESYLQYNSVFTTYEGTVIAEVPHSKKVLAFYNKDCVFLPKLKPGFKEEEFLLELTNIVTRIHNVPIKNSLPDWASSYFLPDEESIKNEIVDINRRMKQFAEILEMKEKTLENFQSKKILFTGSGGELENIIRDVFTELGFEILQAEENRDDLIVKYKDKIAVVEIKGVSKSAAEKHAAQLEKWVASYFELNGVKPKGILIVNAFKDLNLENRIERSFPDQMLRFSEQREHCLITSLQLLCLYYEVKINPSKKDELIGTLFDTIGIYKELTEWQNYITSKHIISATVNV